MEEKGRTEGVELDEIVAREQNVLDEVARRRSERARLERAEAVLEQLVARRQHDAALGVEDGQLAQ